MSPRKTPCRLAKRDLSLYIHPRHHMTTVKEVEEEVATFVVATMSQLKVDISDSARTLVVTAVHELLIDLFERADASAARQGRDTVMVKDLYHAAYVVCYKAAKKAARRAGHVGDP